MSMSLLERLQAQGERFDEQWQADGPAGSPAPAPRGGIGKIDAEQTTEATVVDIVRQTLLRDQPEVVGRSATEGREVLRRSVMAIICEQNLVVSGLTREALADSVIREIAGFGPIDLLLAEPEVTDIMINGPTNLFVEQAGSLRKSGLRFRDEEHLRDTVSRILSPLGKRVDVLSPFVDARLPDGSRLNVVIPPLATQGWIVTIRRFRREPLSLEALAANGMLRVDVAAFLGALVGARANVLIAGPAGSGKTTLLNAMCNCIAPDRERVITIEDSQELRLPAIHAVALEARPANLEGLGEVTIRQLVRNALRMRPDRIIIGEIRDEAGFDFLQAINTGHHGSMSSIHANSALDALYRLENLVMTTGPNLMLQAVREYVASALDLVVHLARGQGGSRRVAQVSVVAGITAGGQLGVEDIVADQTPRFHEALGLLQARMRGRAGDIRAAELVRLARKLEGQA